MTAYDSYHVDTRYELTPEDIKAMKQADDSVCFDFDHRHDPVISQMRLSKRVQPSDGWSGDSARSQYFIPVDWRITDYGESCTAITSLNYGQAGFMVPTQSEHWKTILKLVKPGDALKVEWSGNNYSGAIRDAGIYVDSADLVIYRRKGHDNSHTRHLTLAIDTSVVTHYSNRLIRTA